jgi:hypothetical protein
MKNKQLLWERVLNMSRFATVLNNAESKVDRITNEIFGGTEYCRYFRMEVRTPDGKPRFYSLNSSSKEAARMEASQLVIELMKAYQDERVMWKMVGDNNWILGSTIKTQRKSIFQKTLDYFFGLEN